VSGGRPGMLGPQFLVLRSLVDLPDFGCGLSIVLAGANLARTGASSQPFCWLVVL